MTSAASSSKSNAKSSPDPDAEFEFSDVTTLMCLLCARQFKSLDVLKRHNKESDLHKVCNVCVFPTFRIYGRDLEKLQRLEPQGGSQTEGRCP